MALSDTEITSAIKPGQIKIRPRIAKLNPAGVDLRIDRDLELNPGQQRLAATLERVELSENFLGILHIRSSLAREGIIASLALVDPGFQGQLTVSLHNAGDRPVRLTRGETFNQLSRVRLSKQDTPEIHGTRERASQENKIRRPRIL